MIRRSRVGLLLQDHPLCVQLSWRCGRSPASDTPRWPAAALLGGPGSLEHALRIAAASPGGLSLCWIPFAKCPWLVPRNRFASRGPRRTHTKPMIRAAAHRVGRP